MIILKKTLALVVVGVALLVGTRSMADEPNAMSWRGQVGATFQEWTSDTGVKPAPPTSSNKLFGAPSAAMADDPNAPSWRGQVGTTFQDWTFDTGVKPAPPTSSNNSFGTPSAAIKVDANGTGYKNTVPKVYGAEQGFWDIGTGKITLTLPGTASLNVGEYEEFQIQVTYWKDISAAPVISFLLGAQQFGITNSSTVLTGPKGGEWRMDQSVWRVSSGANPETIIFSGAPGLGSLIDRITVDVRVVPEPSALLLIVAGAGALLFRRRVRP